MEIPLAEPIAQLPRRQEIRIGRIQIPVLGIRDWAIFICMLSIISFPLTDLGKFSALLVQLISAVLVVNPNISPSVVISFGIVGFVFGFMEGGLSLWRLWSTAAAFASGACGFCFSYIISPTSSLLTFISDIWYSFERVIRIRNLSSISRRFIICSEISVGSGDPEIPNRPGPSQLHLWPTFSASKRT